MTFRNVSNGDVQHSNSPPPPKMCFKKIYNPLSSPPT